MGFKDALRRMKEKREAKKEMLRQMQQQYENEKLILERQKSANERELEGYYNEEREEQIKRALEVRRKERQEDINFNHNPLMVKNITNETEWEVLKERNQFTDNGNMFANQPNIHRNNKKLMKDNKKLIKGGNMFRI